MTSQYLTRYFSIEDQNGCICEGATRDEVISRAADYFQDLTEQAGEKDVTIHHLDEDGEPVQSEEYLLTWSSFAPSLYAQHNTMNKAQLGVK